MTQKLNGSALTDRQMQIFRLFLAGKMQKQIALEIKVTPSTVASTLIRIRRKFGAKSLRELYALSTGSVSASVEIASLRAHVASLEKWRHVMEKEITVAVAQRDAALRELAELKAAKP